MPFFEPGDDPGSSFPELLRRVGLTSTPDLSGLDATTLGVPHATTCVALTYDNSSTTNDPVFYVNGIVAASTEITPPTNTRISDVAQVKYIGNFSAGTQAFDGDISDLSFFDRELTAAEIQGLFEGARQNYGV